MFLGKKRVGALAFSLATMAVAWSGSSKAEVTLAENNGWTFSSDGRVNSFLSHVWGDPRPEGLGNQQWVGFNETTQLEQLNADGKLQKTRIRSGYVPSTLAFNVKKQLKSGLKLSSRVEVGIQITNNLPSAPWDPTWMEPRAAFLEVSDSWGSIKAGRDLSLFPRGNLIMNYELGHAYGVGFPCTYETIGGGACGHVGFGTLWPDFRAQLGYSTPNFGDIFQVSVAMLDPRTVPTYLWFLTPLPRVEGEAVAKYMWNPDFGFKAWANGAWQRIGVGVHRLDISTNEVTERKAIYRNPFGVGGGVTAYLGPVKVGGSGYAGKGMDAYGFLGFNPIFVSREQSLPDETRRFRPTRGFLAEASVTIGSTWVMGGFGQAQLDRMPSDTPLNTPNAPPLLRSQTGISAGVFHRIDAFVFGLDYFNARDGFDARVVAPQVGAPRVVSSSQTVHAANGGATLEW
jgi:hypothetical protein